MATVPNSFDAFLESIRLPKELRDDCQEAHQELRAKLLADKTLNPIFVSMFLQGSYARHTGTKPNDNDGHVDVDLVAVTKLLPTQFTPDAVLELFRPFLDREYPDQWEPHDRSMKIEPDDSKVSLDLVVTAAPSEAQEQFFKSFRESNLPELSIEASGDRQSQTFAFREALERINKAFGSADWQKEPLLIPSRDMQRWIPTHPLEQIRWSTDKNRRTNGHYVNVVKALKWWRKEHPAGEYPKSYPLEHFVGDTCPDYIESVAQGVTEALEAIRDRYAPSYFSGSGGVPYMRDRGVDHNVFGRITAEQYLLFYREASAAARDARAALDAPTNPESIARWNKLFVTEFPDPPATPFVAPTLSATGKTSGRFG